MLNPKMFDLLKGQFISNLNQDLLALSGFVSEDALVDIVDNAMEMVRKKADESVDQIKSDVDRFVEDIVKDAKDAKK